MTDIQREIDFDREFVAGGSKRALKDAGATSRDLWMIPIEQIQTIEGFNVRIHNDEYHAHIRQLADSILSEGFYVSKALTGYVANVDGEDVIYVIDGHCRKAAAMLAISEGAVIEKLPVIISQNMTREDMAVALVKSNTGRPLSPFETGVVCKRLAGWGHDVDEICKRLGLVSTAYVEGLLMLVASPKNIREMVTSGEVSASTAIAALKEHGDKAYDMLQEALARAKRSGGNKVTGKHLPNAYFKKTQKKRAPQMFDALAKVNEDKAFGLLKLETREMIEDLIEAMKEAQKKDEAADGGDGKDQGEE